ncbi:hypothetical protein OAJ77_06375 [Rhodospirillales bacterium]|nr:hypothetical protein [Rhodospirillales bacterium]
MNNSFFWESSAYFTLNKFLRLEESDLLSLGWYFAVALIGAFFLYLIIRDYFKVREPLTILLIILCVGFLGRDIPVNTWGGIIPMQPGTATMFSKTLGIIVLYCLLTRRYWLASITMTVVFSIHILGDFILFSIFVFYLCFTKNLKARDILSLIIPVAFLVFKLASSDIVSSSFSDSDILFDAFMAYGRHDSDFLHQSPLALILLVISFFAFPILVRQNVQFVPRLNELLRSILIASVLLVIVSSIYTWIGHEFIKINMFLMLAPVRALNYYTLFFYLVSFVWIISNEKFNPAEKACLLIGLILLHGENLKGILYPLIVVTGGFATRISSRLISFVDNRFTFHHITILLLFVVTLGQIERGGVYNIVFNDSENPLNRGRIGINFYDGVYNIVFNDSAWKYLNRWTVRFHAPPDVWHSYYLLRKHEKDFPLLPIYLNGQGVPSIGNYLNIVGRKSFFMEFGHHFYFNAKLWKEHLIRKEIVEKILKSLKDGIPPSQMVLNQLQARNMGIMVPNQLAQYFPPSLKRKIFGSYKLILFN